MAGSVTYMQRAIALAATAYGETSPNPLVGAILVKGGDIIGKGWHRRAGHPHAEIEALNDAKRNGCATQGATLYVTLEPCSTHGRTPPCTDAIIKAGIKRVVIAATDPNPHHQGAGMRILKEAGLEVVSGILADEATHLNEPFNHWIVNRIPFITAKAAMTLDGKIATANGESKWITGDESRAYAMKLRHGSDAILAGINTILLDDPSLSIRGIETTKKLHRVILDPRAQTPLTAKILTDSDARPFTTIVVTSLGSRQRIAKLSSLVSVLTAPLRNGKIDLHWLVRELGEQKITSLLVEGGGETTAQFLEQGLAHRVAFFYAPRIIGGKDSRKGVAGDGIPTIAEAIKLQDVHYQKLGSDLLLTARILR